MRTSAPVRILGSRVDIVSLAQAEDRVARLIAERRFAHVVTFGSEMAMLAARDNAYRDVINQADLVVADTVGVVYAGRLLGAALPDRVAGIELAEAVCGRCARNGTPVFLFGAVPGVAEAAALALVKRYPTLKVAGVQHGYFAEAEEPEIVDAIRNSGAQLLLVALGFPKQEFWIRRHAQALGGITCIGVGGTLDVFAGRVTRAPKIMRQAGLEWLYRLLREPQRLARQLVLPQFAVSVISQAWHQRRLKKREPS